MTDRLQPALRILCLHDAYSNAGELKESLSILGDRLYERHGSIDLIYVNSPIALPTDSSVEHPRVWWEEIARKDAVPSEASIQYRGLDASLLLIRQVWTSCPFVGILGVGQGAAVAALFMMTFEAARIPPPSFGVLVSGQSFLKEAENLLTDHIPCLHLVDPEGSAGRLQQDLLFQQLGGRMHVKRQTSKSFTKTDYNAIGRFIVEQTKVQGQSTALALHTALREVERDASQLLAEHIAENPPTALMAVIQPGAVAGWSGNKRREPEEEGGGAPCPSEFLLRREKRTGTGAGRMHPNQQSPNEESREEQEKNE